MQESAEYTHFFRTILRTWTDASQITVAKWSLSTNEENTFATSGAVSAGALENMLDGYIDRAVDYAEAVTTPTSEQDDAAEAVQFAILRSGVIGTKVVP